MSDARWRRVAFVALVVASLLNAAKGLGGDVQPLGFPWYVLTYGHGFIRRGLVGTIFMWLNPDATPSQHYARALVVHVLVTTGLLALLATWAWREAGRHEARGRRLVLCGTFAFFLSQLVPTLFVIGGYLDPWLFLVAALGAVAVTRKRYGMAGAIGALGPFIHDAAILSWLPVLGVAVLHALREAPRAWRLRWPLLLPFVALAMVMAFHSPTAAQRAVDALVVGDDVKSVLHEQQFGFSLSFLVPRMLARIVAGRGHVLAAAAFYWPPALVTAACAVKLARLRGWKELACAALAVFGPCLVLLVAFDLSRFLLWACVGAVILLLGTASLAPEKVAESASRPGLVEGALLIALTVMSLSPHAYSYFERTELSYALGPTFVLGSPGAYATYWFADTYNREWADGDALRLHCRAAGARATRAGECAWELGENGYVENTSLTLASGPHELTIGLAATCPSATARVELSRSGLRGYANRESAEVQPVAGRFVLPFSVGVREAAHARFAVRVTAPSGCVRIDEIRIENVASRSR